MPSEPTEADIQLVAEAMADASGAAYTYEYERWAPYVLRALAGAGRLTPDGAEVREEHREPRNDQGGPMEVWLDEERECITVEINGAKRFRRWWFGKIDGAPAVEWCHGVHEDAVRLDAWVEADEDGTG